MLKATSSIVNVSQITGVLPVANGGTGVTTSTGTGAVVLSSSPTLVTPALGTPASGTLTNATGLPIDGGTTGILPVARGGSGTATPALVQGSNITITGSWPNQTISAPAPGAGTVTSVGGTGTVNGISLSGTVTTSGNLTLGGALSGVSLTTQVTGTLPVANGGTGVTTSTGTGSTVLSAAPTLSGNVTLSTGNLIVASGQGIDFSATPGTGTSELLDDYEEGTWTPIDDSGAGLVFSDAFGFYTKVGDTVTAWGRVTFPITGSGLTILVGGLPYVISGNSQPGGGFIRLTNSGRNDTIQASGASTFILFFDNNLNAAVNIQYSGDRVDFVVIYKV